MNKINKSAIIKGREQSLSNDTTFEEYPKRYPLDKVLSCHYKVNVSRQDGFLLLLFEIQAKLRVHDTRDNVLFDYPMKRKEEMEVIDQEDEMEEGVYIPGPSIDLDGLALDVIQSSLPLRLVRKKDIPLPKGISGVSFVSEEELQEERSNFSMDDLPSFPSKDDR